MNLIHEVIIPLLVGAGTSCLIIGILWVIGWLSNLIGIGLCNGGKGEFIITGFFILSGIGIPFLLIFAFRKLKNIWSNIE